MDAGTNIRNGLVEKFQRYHNEFKNIPDSISYLYQHPDVWKSVNIQNVGVKDFETFWDWVEGVLPFGLNMKKEMIFEMCGKDKDGGYPLDRDGRAVMVIISDKLNKELRNVRDNEIKRSKKTQKELAELYGLKQQAISKILQKDGIPQKSSKTKISYTMNNYTKPETAAFKIREKFGDEFAKKLKDEL